MKKDRINTHPSSSNNESFENDRLWRSIYGDEPRDLFLKALRAYSAGSDRQAWLVEAVIRTSRGVADDTGLLHSEDHKRLLVIKARYRIFARVSDLPDPVTFASAHAMLRLLFF